MTCFIARAAGLIFDFAFSKANYWRGPRGSSEGSTRIAAATRSASRSSDPLRTLLSGLVVTSAAQVAVAATLTVPSAKFPTIQSAMDFAANGDEIVVAMGVYPENLNCFGKALKLRSVSGSGLTTIDASRNDGTGVRFTPSTDAVLSIEGFTIANAANSGVIVVGGELKLTNCVFSQCRAAQRGGAVSAEECVVSVTGTKFLACSTSGSSNSAVGGAIYATGCAVDLLECTFDQCSTTARLQSRDTLFARGGAVYLLGCSGSALSCKFTDCGSTAEDQGVICGCRGCGATESMYYIDYGGGAVANGGALAADSGTTVTIGNCEFNRCRVAASSFMLTGNRLSGPMGGSITTEAAGGAVWAVGRSSVTIQGGTFSESGADATVLVEAYEGSGDGIACSGCCLSCQTGGDKSRGSWAVGGGAIFAYDASLSLAGVDLNASSATGAVHTRTFQGVAKDGLGCIENQSERPGISGSAIYLGRLQSGRIESTRISGGTGTQIVSFQSAPSIIGLIANGGGSAASGISIEGMSALIYQSVFSGFSGWGVTSSAGANPSISSSMLCGNGSLGVAGNWGDSGNNLIQTTCVDHDCNHDGIDDGFQIAIGTAKDCDGNGIPDTCDINEGRATDCDGDDVPDSCQFRPTTIASATLSPLQSGTTLIHTFSDVKATGGPVVATINAQGDLSSTLEYITMKANGVTLGKLWEVGGQDCAPLTTEFTIPTEQFNSILAGGSVLQFQFVPSAQVTPGQCATSYVKVTLEYQPKVPGDLDGSGIPDVCEAGRFDLDGNRVIDFGDIALLMLDFGPCTNCPDDFDQNGRIDFGDVALLMLEFGNLP